jgi:hypothetical protein
MVSSKASPVASLTYEEIGQTLPRPRDFKFSPRQTRRTPGNILKLLKILKDLKLITASQQKTIID